MSLFAAQWRAIPLPDAELRLLPQWLAADEADALFEELQRSIPWEVHRIRIFGREVDSPRLSCWIGDAGATYVYSRTRFEPHPWTQALSSLRWRVQQACGARFNSVLANLYRHGNDAMGWHSDDEPERCGERVAGRGRGDADDHAGDEAERVLLEPLVKDLRGRHPWRA